jgi:hypothetical protein
MWGFRLGLVGDLGQTENSLDTLQHMEVLRPDSVILAGDLSYADGYQPRWDSWGRLMQPYATSVPWMMIEVCLPLYLPPPSFSPSVSLPLCVCVCVCVCGVCLCV